MKDIMGLVIAAMISTTLLYFIALGYALWMTV